jgi:hypothetical protein
MLSLKWDIRKQDADIFVQIIRQLYTVDRSASVNAAHFFVVHVRRKRRTEVAKNVPLHPGNRVAPQNRAAGGRMFVLSWLWRRRLGGRKLQQQRKYGTGWLTSGID